MTSYHKQMLFPDRIDQYLQRNTTKMHCQVSVVDPFVILIRNIFITLLLDSCDVILVVSYY